MLPPRFRCAPLVLGALTFLLFAPAPAHADCTPDAPGEGDTVTCSGNDADGFAAGVDDVTVNVEAGATVDNGGVDGVDAIAILNDSEVTNDGTITASGTDSHGISAGDDTEILNGTTGTITVNGTDSFGITVGDNNTVRNLGVIQTGAASNGARGISLGNDNGNVFQGTAGFISLTGDDTIGILAGDGNTIELDSSGAPNTGIAITGDNAIGIDVGDGNSITNEQRIVITGDDAIGIRAVGSVGAGNTVRSVGAVGSLSATGVDSVGILVLGEDNTITVGHTVLGGTGTGAGVVFGAGSDNNELEINSPDGRLGAGSGVAIRGNTGREVVRLRGLLDGDALLAGGDDELEIATTGQVTPGVSVDGGAGTDDLVLAGSTTNPVALNLSLFQNFETLAVRTGALQPTNVWTLQGSASFPDGITFERGTVVIDGPVSLTGDYVQQAETTLRVGLNGDGTSDRLTVVGDVDLAGALRVVQNEPLPIGGVFTVFDFTGSQTGAFSLIRLPNSASLNFSAATLANQVQITVTRNPFAAIPTSSNQGQVALLLDRALAAGVGPDLATTIVNLDQLGVVGLQNALDRLHPEAYDAHTQVTLQQGERFGRLLLDRIQTCPSEVPQTARRGRLPAVSAPPPACGARGWTPWASGFGAFADRDGAV
ncbi:MAG: hypothetical protein MJE66_05990, partial [Proteobacteria bacterium]|nr:hypothetical protein [Pseudomonadota bacterium]